MAHKQVLFLTEAMMTEIPEPHAKNDAAPSLE